MKQTGTGVAVKKWPNETFEQMLKRFNNTTERCCIDLKKSSITRRKKNKQENHPKTF